MVEPVAFGFNEETAANNYFQQRTVAAGESLCLEGISGHGG